MHGVVYLPYAFTAATLTAALACLLRGMRLSRKTPLICAGMLAGVALLTRPFDLLLFAVPSLLFLAARRRTRRLDTLRKLGWVAVGGAPFLALLLVFDVMVTGHPFLMPLSAADPLNRFGFGARQIMPGEPTVGYSFSTAVLSLRANLHGMPSWLLGGPVLAALAALGLLFRTSPSRAATPRRGRSGVSPRVPLLVGHRAVRARSGQRPRTALLPAGVRAGRHPGRRHLRPGLRTRARTAGEGHGPGA